MKKWLSTILTCLLALCLFACASVKAEEGDLQEAVEDCGSDHSFHCFDRTETIIQDADGEHKCFWEDGKAFFDDNAYVEPCIHYPWQRRQTQKSATLTLQTEYDMWFSDRHGELDFTQYDLEQRNPCRNYYPVEFEYDKEKIEIKPNPEKNNHFIIKVLQPCDNEIIVSIISEYHDTDEMFDENGNPYSIPCPSYLKVPISTVE
ncbi:MAG: hypothetical protein J1F69_03940 [Clostridiales bacterium]|nr:hypothetical protein [Clostridiales bacterium]